MTDLTTITTPFGLLDTETREALRAHGGPYEFVDISGSWDEIDAPAWQKNSTYRVKPAPPKPREWWITAGNCVWDTLDEAMAARGGVPVLVRGVLP